MNRSGIGIIPTHIRVSGTLRIPLDAFRTCTSMGERAFDTAHVGTPELEPAFTPDVELGFEADPPRRPLPLVEVTANLDRLLASDDPTLRALAGQYDLAEYLLAVSAHEAWDLRR